MEFYIDKNDKYRDKILQIYQEHNPSLIDTVDSTLADWSGKEEELIEKLRKKYSKKATQQELIQESTYNKVVSELKTIYKKDIRPLEEAYKFDVFYTPFLEDVDFEAKPMVMLLGQYSVGKTSFIRHLVGKDFIGMRIGPEPTTDRFVAVMKSRTGESQVIPGNALVCTADKPFRTLQRFGGAFLDKLECSENDISSNLSLLNHITFIDTPGVLSGEKQRTMRQYDFGAVVEWFAARCDRILLLFDAHKLDISDEFKRVIESLKGNDDKVRIVLNKSDSISHQQLMRVYGALMWSLGKVIKTPEVLRVYIGSFWDNPLDNSHECYPLFQKEGEDLINDLRSLPHNSAVRKINELVKRARLAKVHAFIVSSLRSQLPSFMGKSKKQNKLLEDLPNQFSRISKQYGISPSDFPNIARFKKFFEDLDLAKFPKLNEKLIKKLDYALSNDIPALMQLVNNPDVASIIPVATLQLNSEPDFAANPFAGASADWIIGVDEKRRSDEMLKLLVRDPKGKISGDAAKTAFASSGLSNSVLYQIWILADIDGDNALNSDEFAIANHLIREYKSGNPLPDILPPSYFPPKVK